MSGEFSGKSLNLGNFCQMIFDCNINQRSYLHVPQDFADGAISSLSCRHIGYRDHCNRPTVELFRTNQYRDWGTSELDSGGRAINTALGQVSWKFNPIYPSCPGLNSAKKVARALAFHFIIGPNLANLGYDPVCIQLDRLSKMKLQPAKCVYTQAMCSHWAYLLRVFIIDYCWGRGWPFLHTWARPSLALGCACYAYIWENCCLTLKTGMSDKVIKSFDNQKEACP